MSIDDGKKPKEASMLIDLKQNEEEKKLVKEFWPIFSKIKEMSRKPDLQDVDCIMIAEWAFRIGRLVGRDELAEHVKQEACIHEYLYNRDGARCHKCLAELTQCSSD